MFSSDRGGLWWKDLARRCLKKKNRTVPAENNAKIKIENQQNWTKNYFSPLYPTYMDAPPPDNASLDPPVATNMRGEEEGASGDHDGGEDDGDESGKLLYNVLKKKKYQNK